MQEKLSDNDDWPIKLRVAMLMLNFIPLIHILVCVCLIYFDFHGHGILYALVCFYLCPPVICRMILFFSPIKGGSYTLESREFITWWATAQTQVVFCRMPVWEELLRMIPGAYSLWLRLWGAHIGKLTYWSPELRILDRSFLHIGDNVITGVGVRVNAHVIDTDDSGTVLKIASINIGDRVKVGGYSLLTSGCIIDPDEQLRSFTLLPPFSHWKSGKRYKAASPLAKRD